MPRGRTLDVVAASSVGTIRPCACGSTIQVLREAVGGLLSTIRRHVDCALLD